MYACLWFLWQSWLSEEGVVRTLLSEPIGTLQAELFTPSHHTMWCCQSHPEIMHVCLCYFYVWLLSNYVYVNAGLSLYLHLNVKFIFSKCSRATYWNVCVCVPLLSVYWLYTPFSLWLLSMLSTYTFRQVCVLLTLHLWGPVWVWVWGYFWLFGQKLVWESWVES